MGFFEESAGVKSMARLVTFMCAFAGMYNAALIPWSDKSDTCLAAAVALLVTSGITKTITKLTEKKDG